MSLLRDSRINNHQAEDQQQYNENRIFKNYLHNHLKSLYQISSCLNIFYNNDSRIFELVSNYDKYELLEYMDILEATLQKA